MSIELKPFSWDRMIEAVEAVRQRALRATKALAQAGIPYAVTGGNAVAAWVARVDRAAVRNTQDVDILIRRSDLPSVTLALESIGFYCREILGVVCFLDTPDSHPRDAVHIVFANEKVKADNVAPTADVDERITAEDYEIVDLIPLVRMKLTSSRRFTTKRMNAEISLMWACSKNRSPLVIAKGIPRTVSSIWISRL